MYWYSVALLVNVDKLFTYSSDVLLIPGCRVLVEFGTSLATGICWKRLEAVPKGMKVKPVHEVIDEKPVLPDDLLKLAEWISRYWQHPLGMVLATIFPKGMQLQTARRVRVAQDSHSGMDDTLGADQQTILNALKDNLWHELDILKKELKLKSFHRLLQDLEDAELIEIERSYDQRLTKKKANFVRYLAPGQKLPARQQQALDMVAKAGVIKQSLLAAEFSYAILKSLKEKGLIAIESKTLADDGYNWPQKSQDVRPNLTDEQAHAVNTLVPLIHKGEFSSWLLHGITGSGKTEVYIRLINQALAMGKTALLLVPEIALTPQAVERFYNAFGDIIGLMHSHLNDRQRLLQFKRVASGKARLVIGVRSAVFAPLNNLGVVIVDEEHEGSYKQDKSPFYNARDVAVLRASMHKAVVVLGSATPSLESTNNATSGKYGLLKLKKRPGVALVPHVELINMQGHDNKNIITPQLAQHIEDCLNQGGQAILLQNRRGWSSFVQCATCGCLFKCENCDISLNYHRTNEKLLCHWCGHNQDLPRTCPDCGGAVFNFGSPGTQQVESQLKLLFPAARVLRMDSDTTGSRSAYEQMFERMKNREIDILLGTQMISKGLDFPGITLVGVINADTGLTLPDFRAAERTFQLLTQVAGRSGRGDKPGKVLIQTYQPNHYAIALAVKQDFEAFAKIEMPLRKEFFYPPYTRLARLVFSCANQQKLTNAMHRVEDTVKTIGQSLDHTMQRLDGPFPAPLARLRNNYRWQVIVRSTSVQGLQTLVQKVVSKIKIGSAIKLAIDIDPYSLL